MSEHLHVLKALEWIGENIALSFFIGIAALGKDAVFLFNRQSRCTTALIIRPEIGHDIVQLNTTLFISIEHNRLH